jgi:hypothetical protein
MTTSNYTNYTNTLKGVLIFLTLFLLTATLYGEIGISSKYLEVVMDNASGRFYVKTLIGDPDNPNDDKKILLFDKIPPTSYPTLFVDNEGFEVGTEDGYFENKPTISKNKLTWAWRPNKYNKIKLIQIVEIVTNIFTLRDDIVRITFLVVNEDLKEHDVNIRFIFDTVLGESEKAPFFVPPYGKIEKETVFYENNMPNLWYSFDRLDKPKIKTMGILSGMEDVTTPSMVVFANWRKLSKTKWDYTPEVGSSFSEGLFGAKDTAVAVYFKKTRLKPQEIAIYSTMYGLFGDTIKKIENVFLSLSIPETVKSFPIKASLTIENKSSINLKDIKVKLIVDTNLFYASNYTLTLSNLPYEDSTSFSWDIFPVGQVQDGEYIARVSFEALALSTNVYGEISKKFTIKLGTQEQLKPESLQEIGLKQTNISTNYQLTTTNFVFITNTVMITNIITLTNEYEDWASGVKKINTLLEILNEELNNLIITYHLATSDEKKKRIRERIELIKTQIEVEKSKLKAQEQKGAK